MQAAVTLAQLTAFLAVHTCIPMMGDGDIKPSPIAGWSLEEDQRRQLGLTPGGSTLVYKINDRQIMLDISGAKMLLMYVGADAEQGLEMFEGALDLIYPQHQRQEEVAHPGGGNRRVRGYFIDFGPQRSCKIEVEFPAPGTVNDQSRFLVRMTAFEPAPVNLFLPALQPGDGNNNG